MKTNEKIRRIQNITAMIDKFDIKVPRVAVLGSQSSGKSSVLEQLLKKEIIPRGPSLVTRCPIIIHLKENTEGADYAVFEHIERPFTDWNEVREIIEKRMKEICGENRGISADPITVHLYIKDALELTILDLPGLTKVAIGDQPEDIEHIIENMVMEYIKDQNSVILAIMSANSDIATSDALKIAKIVDPLGERTLGVLTKIDIMDKGTDCVEILKNKEPRLKLGYVGVINRSHKDIINKLSIENALKKEAQFFQNSQMYKIFLPEIGSNFLLSKLHTIFYEKTCKAIPGIKDQIVTKLNIKIKKLNELELPDNYSKNIKYGLTSRYYTALHELLKYKITNDDIFINESENFIGKFATMFTYETTRKNTMLDYNPIESRSIFISENYFMKVLKINVKEMRDMYLQKAEKITADLMSQINLIKSKRFPKLASKLNSIACSALRRQLNDINKSIEYFSKIQEVYINVNHPEFEKQQIINENISNSKTYSSSYLEKKMTISFTENYLSIISREMEDYVIKTLNFHLFDFIFNDLQQLLLSENLDDSFYKENSEITEKKEKLNNEISQLSDIIENLYLL